jgi:uncharacterized membrane protein
MITEATSAKEAFPQSALDAIAAKIAEVEKTTNAEIRISIRDIRDASEADLSVKELTLREFAELRMHQTAQRTGILLLILFSERKFYIFGDEGVSRFIDTTKWEDVAAELGAHFKSAQYEQGVISALTKIEHHLVGVLPKRESSTNELSDEVVVR